jgi:hypothetical protein
VPEALAAVAAAGAEAQHVNLLVQERPLAREIHQKVLIQ